MPRVAGCGASAEADAELEAVVVAFAAFEAFVAADGVTTDDAAAAAINRIVAIIRGRACVRGS